MATCLTPKERYPRLTEYSTRSEQAHQANTSIASTAILHEKEETLNYRLGQFENSPVIAGKSQSFFSWVYDSGLSWEAKVKSQCATLPASYLLSAAQILFKV